MQLKTLIQEFSRRRLAYLLGILCLLYVCLIVPIGLPGLALQRSSRKGGDRGATEFCFLLGSVIATPIAILMLAGATYEGYVGGNGRRNEHGSHGLRVCWDWYAWHPLA